MAFVPWGYYAGRRLGSGAKLILAVFFALVALAFSIRAIVDRDWGTFAGALVVAAVFAVVIYVYRPDGPIKFRKPKDSGPSLRKTEIAREIAKEAFGRSTQPPTSQKK